MTYLADNDDDGSILCAICVANSVPGFWTHIIQPSLQPKGQKADPTDTARPSDPRTDRRTDGRTDGRAIQPYPFHFSDGYDERERVWPRIQYLLVFTCSNALSHKKVEWFIRSLPPPTALTKWTEHWLGNLLLLFQNKAPRSLGCLVFSDAAPSV